MITEDQKKHNLDLFLRKLDQVGVDTTKIRESGFTDKLREATFSFSSDSGLAGSGLLLQTVLYVLTPFAVKMNDLLDEKVRVDKNTLVKVSLLHHISKAIKFIPNDNEWEISKRGLLYKYDTNLPSLRVGLHSVALCSELGITLSPEEVEAMTVNDRDSTDAQSRYYSSTLASIIRSADEFTYLQSKALSKQ